MAPTNDDTIPASYKYAWSDESDISIQDFLKKFRPSMVQNDSTKSWIWVHGSGPSRERKGADAAIAEATELLKEVTDKVENIKNDTSIPIRSNKKTGAKSKKELREQLQAEATENLKDIATKHGYTCGKWLIHAPSDKVDAIWTSVATSLCASGPLKSTSAFSAKVSTSSQDEGSRGQHIICIYLPDVYDKTQVTEAMKVLLRNYGCTLSGVKADLYTLIGINSKHASGIPSMVWKNSAVLSDKEAKELKDAYFAELVTKSTMPSEATASAENPTEAVPKGSATGTETGLKKPKAKPKPKKVANPFGSDSEEDEVKKTEASKPVAAQAKRVQQDDEADETEPPKKKRAVGN